MVIYNENIKTAFFFGEKTIYNYKGLESPFSTKIYIGADFKNSFEKFIGKIKNFRFYSDNFPLIKRVGFGICLACEVGYFFNEVDNKCVKCYSICLKCLNYDINSCISCRKGFSLLVKKNFTAFFTGVCVSNCPKGFNKSYPHLNEQSSFKHLLNDNGVSLNQNSHIMFKKTLPLPHTVKNGFLYLYN